MGAIAALFCANAHALDLAPSVSIGTTGFGEHLSIPLAQKLDLRIGGNLLDHDYSGKSGSVSYDFQLQLRSIDFRRFSPYLGIGWGSNPAAEGWSVNADLGALFQGSPHVSLNNSGCNLPGAMCAALQSDIAAETANLRDKGDSFQVYPVLRIGAVYRF